MKIVSTDNAEHYAWGDQCDGWHLYHGEDFSVIQERMPAKTTEISHLHRRSRQFFYVLSGRLCIVAGDVRHELTPECGLMIAPGQSHRVFNDSDSEVRFLVMSTPPSHEDRIPTG